MKKAYEDGHETAYRKMKKEGVRSWGERPCHPSKERREIDKRAKRLLTHVLAQPWAPRKGKAIELGCGTAPMLRWLCKRGFSGLGVDVSKTAISMARAQSRGLCIRFKRADLVSFRSEKVGTFDLALDGRCLHCITEPADRKAFLRNVRRLLRTEGLFIVLSTCAPVNRRLFSQTQPKLKLVGHTIYAPFDGAGEYEGSRTIGGCDCVPMRYIGHWQSILTEIRRAGFGPQLIWYDAPYGQDSGGDLAVGALALR